MSGASSANPYPGLRPFREDEEHLFFGRETQIDAMVDRLAETHFLAVVGTSGSGKSSLVNCGLRPALHRGLMARAGTVWRMAQFRPGGKPMRAMAEALARPGLLFDTPEAAPLSLADIVETTLCMSKLGLIDLYEQSRLEGVNLLVVVDQFEELFRYRKFGTSSGHTEFGLDEDSTAFVNLLLEVEARPPCPIYVVLTMRSDFLGNCAQFFGLPEAINKGQYLVPRMSRDERRAAIANPAMVFGAKIAPVLLTRLINDVGDNPDQLSILQHALNRTWAKWQDKTGGKGPLDLAHYEAIGTMAQALDAHAEEAYAALGGERSQILCEKLFKALTDKGTDVRGVRRPTRLGALCGLADATEAEIASVIDVFRDLSRSFLMPPAGEPVNAGTVIDISHESLMRVWKRLKQWGDEEAQSAQMYCDLVAAAGKRKARQGGLWRDPELQLALDWQERNRPNPAWAEQYRPEAEFAPTMAFLEESRAARQRELDAARRKAKQNSLIIAFIMVVVASAAVAFASLYQRAEAARSVAASARDHLAARTKEAQQNLDTARNNLWSALAALALAEVERHPVNAAKLAIAAWPRDAATDIPKREVTLNAVSHSLAGLHERSRIRVGNPISSVAFSPDGASMLTGLADGTARLWDVATCKEIRVFKGHEDVVKSVAFGSDGKSVLTGSKDKTARLWEVTTGKEIRAFKGHEGAVESVAFSPDGGRVLTGSYDFTARLWDVATGKELRVFKGLEGPFWSVAFGPDGTRVLTGSTLWDTMTGKELRAFKVPGEAVRSSAFSPDGKLVLTGHTDTTVRLWNVATGKELRVFKGHEGWVDSVAFSPDGKRVLTGSSETARLWDAATGQELRAFKGHEDVVNSAAFSPDGMHVNTARLWDAATGQEIRAFKGQSIAFSPDGARVLTGSKDARLWDATTGKEIRAFKGHEGWVDSVAFSPDGKRVLTGSSDRTARLWDAATGKEIRAFKGHEDAVNSVAFSPDGGRVLTGSMDNTARLWDAGTGQEIRAFRHEFLVISVAFSPDGARVLTGSVDTARLWDAATGQELRVFKRHVESVLVRIAFSPDGARVLTGSLDGTARLWDAATGQELRAFKGHEDAVNSVALSPDGARVLTGSSDKTARLWDATTGKEIRAFKGHEGAVESVAFSPDGGRVLTGSLDGTARLWDISAIPKGNIFDIACALLPDHDLSGLGKDDYGLDLSSEPPICQKDETGKYKTILPD